uniref:Transcription factor CBF/NF-Y/archaeal histone domain-containing protein n=1 Tax=Panagrolaimus sp. JU765 TaxID=591449 RepID=A0AC34QX88_9BILA
MLNDEKSEPSSSAMETERKRSPKKSYAREVIDLPQTKMRGMIKAAYPYVNIEEDALIALTKAAELFVQELARQAVELTKKTYIHYDDIARTVRSQQKKAFTVLRPILPFTRPFHEVKKIINQADENDEPEDDD